MRESTDRETRYCLTCRYALRGLSQGECPECGRRFDPLDPRTTASRPAGNIRQGLADLALVLTVGACLAVAVALVVSAIGVSPLILWLAGIAAAPFVLVLLAIAAIPSVPLTRRTRIGAVVGSAIFVSIVTTGWPFRVTFAVHRPALDRCVARVRSGTMPVGVAPMNVGLFRFIRVSQSRGNVGLQMTGDGGGGTFLVHRSTGNAWTWFNTNWERELGAGWVLVEQD